MARIEIVEYQARWPGEFAAVGARLRMAIGGAALAIHHIGSTSVAGLAAKDVIDVQVSVANLELGDAVMTGFAEAGLPLREDIVHDHVPVGEDPDEALWAKRMGGVARKVHVHVRVPGRPNHRYPLLFRDFLRASPGASGSYGLIKRELAARHADDTDAYYAVKDPVCDLIMEAAERWAVEAGWAIPPTDG